MLNVFCPASFPPICVGGKLRSLCLITLNLSLKLFRVRSVLLIIIHVKYKKGGAWSWKPSFLCLVMDCPWAMCSLCTRMKLLPSTKALKSRGSTMEIDRPHTFWRHLVMHTEEFAVEGTVFASFRAIRSIQLLSALEAKIIDMALYSLWLLQTQDSTCIDI